MLYKKVHRQYIRQFRIGRKFRFFGDVHEVAEKPYIENNTILVNGVDLIPLYSGRLLNRSVFVWLD